MLTVKQVRAVLEGHADSIGKNKDGYIVLRRGFFYTNGMSGEKFADSAVRRLAEAGIQTRIVNTAVIWKAFRGGASVAQGSHFKAILVAQ